MLGHRPDLHPLAKTAMSTSSITTPSPSSPERMLSAESAVALDVQIRRLIAKAISYSDGGYSKDEVYDLLTEGATTLVVVLRDAKDTHQNPLSGLDKKQIAIEALNKILDQILPAVKTSLLASITASMPWYVRWAIYAISKLWTPDFEAKFRERIPSLIQSAFDGLKPFWPRSAAA